MAVKVYGTIRSACVQRVLACLLEKGVDFDVVHVDLEAGEQKRPEFLVLQAINISYYVNFRQCMYFFNIIFLSLYIYTYE
jgi:hypothetical protein